MNKPAEESLDRPQPNEKPPRSSRIKRVLIHCIAYYLLLVFIIAVLQRRLMYQPGRADQITAADSTWRPDSVNDFSCQTSDGLKLNGWHVVRQGHDCKDDEQFRMSLKYARFVVLFFHGNGGDRRGREYEAHVFNANEADVLILDYRGYGDNEGSPSETGLTMDAQALWDYATVEVGIAHDNIVIAGASLGGGVACRLAVDCCESGEPPAALIVRSTFASMADAAGHHYPWLPVRFLLLDRYESISQAAKITCPVLQLHGNADNIVPFESGRSLFDALPDKSNSGIAKQFVELNGISHNNVVIGAGNEYAGAIRELFLKINDN